MIYGFFSLMLFVVMPVAGFILFAQMMNLARKVKELSKRLDQLESHGVRIAQPSALSEPPPVPVSPARASIGPAVAETLRETDIEALLAGNWLVRIGVLAILFGAAFFLKYAFDNRWIGETGRVILGITSAIVLLWLGEHYQNKGYRRFSQTLTGGGIALLYLSIYAAFAFYHLIPQPAAFLFMILVTGASIVLAVRYDALPTAVLATLGGFLTPFLLSTGVDNEVGLFSYILLLDLGILVAAYFRNWPALNYQSFFLTAVTFVAWAERFYMPSKLWTTILFLSLFFTLFAFLTIFYNIIHSRKASAPELVLAFLNAALYFGAMYALLVDKYEDYLGSFALVMGGAYVALAYFTSVRHREDKYLIWFLLGIATTFVTLAIPIQLEQNWITIGWATEGAILAYIGFRYGSRNTLLAAMGILVLVFFRLLIFDADFSYSFVKEEFTLFLNRRTLSFVIGIAAMLFTAYLLAREQEEVLDQARMFAGCLLIAANILAVVLLSVETLDYLKQLHLQDRISSNALRYAQGLSLSIIWAVYATFLIIVGFSRDYRPIRYMALLLFGITIVKVFFIDLSELERFYRIISFVALGIILIAVSLLYQKYRSVLVGPGTTGERAE